MTFHTQLQDQLRGHVTFLAQAPRNGRTSPQHLAASLDYCATTLQQCGWTTQLQSFERRNVLGIADHANPWWPFGWFPRLAGTNLVASYGTEGPALVIVAHIDTVGVSPGADDNASGVAAALEAARLISQTGTRRRVLIGLVDLEETGHQGSKHLARQLHHTNADISGVICLESIGFFDDKDGSQTLPRIFTGIQVDPLPAGPVAANFMAVLYRRSSALLGTMWAELANAEGLATVRFEDRRVDGWRSQVSIAFKPALANLDRSDHASFQSYGVPSICICDLPPLRSPHYHRTTDLPQTLDYRRMAAATIATAQVATRDLLTTPSGPPADG